MDSVGLSLDDTHPRAGAGLCVRRVEVVNSIWLILGLFGFWLLVVLCKYGLFWLMVMVGCGGSCETGVLADGGFLALGVRATGVGS